MNGEEPSGISRRRVLTGIATGVAVAGGGAAMFAGSAGAQTQTSFNIDNSEITTVDGDISGVSVELDHKVTWEGFDVPVAAAAYTDEVTVAPASGSEDVTFTLYDNTDNPQRLENWSSKDDGSGGWGGEGEYASQDPNSYIEATGPAQEGYVHANIFWRVLSDGGLGARSVENPGDITQTEFATPPSDGSTDDVEVTYTKTVTLYYDDNGTLKPMGQAGTVQSASSTDTFTVSVTNEPSTAEASGSGTSSATE